MYVVTFRAYCGMSHELGRYETLEEARQRIRQRNRYAQTQGCEVVRLDRTSWEHQEPENCVMVPDFAGTLHVKKVKH